MTNYYIFVRFLMVLESAVFNLELHSTLSSNNWTAVYVMSVPITDAKTTHEKEDND